MANLLARLAKLELAHGPGRSVCLWRDADRQTTEEVIAEYVARHPQDAAAKFTVFCWHLGGETAA